ncbi:Threonylcarbamoyl-AMP synthase [Candidatus Nitrotoga sp. HW29]|uniref:L-threonylcarbamoyladenylate synthase n=1 Tax=Candidatus Nitrotoga sp. HW29 TaxID=2886963 RepID=UPI001FA063F2|nr:L-threonylcarbamoyladenylate synthase [Candidatus Nitrotoga sp. HW29]CAH1903773.1 Threonylcarbamoyl-AMP synthase [Candidatus Nitrotoga sp. HW29]
MNPYTIPNDQIQAAAVLLRSGETVAFPTETVYGLGADASNPLAVQKIFEIKGRPLYHPLIVHIATTAQLSTWAQNIPDDAWRLATAFWPGPLTLILQRSSKVPNEVTGGQDTVGLRVPDHPIATALLHAFDGGIAAPSANRFGQVSPTTAQHVHDKLGSKVGMLLDGGPCRIGVESTIVSLTHSQSVLLRPGGLSIEAIENTINKKVLLTQAATPKVRASGTLDSHYAPTTPIEIHPADELWHRAHQLAKLGYKVAVLKISDGSKYINSSGIKCFQMPLLADEYGHDLYATLHRIDHINFDRLLAETPPATQEWIAINDRLRRAAHSGHS